ncbi:MAG: serpin family protein [Bacteroidota bacterium]|nr:serpin family protein [Candidatus Kapabacteria bacterium]MDW8219144.1 serpin family protein [Bacteroidota bacterium]
MNVSRNLGIWWIVAISGYAIACTTPPIDPSSGQVRALTEREHKVAVANNTFAVRLFQETSRIEGSKNIFLSPLSYMQALTMTANGAAGATRDSIMRALQLSGIPINDINEASRTLREYLLGLDKSVEIRIANGIWYNQRFTVEQAFLSAVRQSFGAELRGMAFGSADVKGDINRWVEQQTNNRIKNLIQRNFTADDLMCLVNAVYFNAVWKTQFRQEDTQNEPFRREDGSSLVCAMMNLSKPIDVRVASLGQARLVELPYSGGQFAMTLLLPHEGERLSRVIAQLSPASLNQAIQSMTTTSTLLALPKFSLQTRYEETRTTRRELHALGMGLAFSGAADFSAMYRPPVQAAISFVVHQTFLQVDERGTEAAAATAVGIRVTSVAPQPVIRFDRPFAFFIRERSTGMILFVGALYEPTSS